MEDFAQQEAIVVRKWCIRRMRGPTRVHQQNHWCRWRWLRCKWIELSSRAVLGRRHEGLQASLLVLCLLLLLRFKATVRYNGLATYVSADSHVVLEYNCYFRERDVLEAHTRWTSNCSWHSKAREPFRRTALVGRLPERHQRPAGIVSLAFAILLAWCLFSYTISFKVTWIMKSFSRYCISHSSYKMIKTRASKSD